jgi:hypothetical protein
MASPRYRKLRIDCLEQRCMLAAAIGPLTISPLDPFVVPPLTDAPESPAEIDPYLNGKFFPQWAPDGASPGAAIQRRLVERGSSGFSVPIHYLGRDPNGYVEEGNVAFLNLPSGWSATYNGASDPWVHLQFPTHVPAGQIDLRYKLTDSEGLSSNVGVLRLVFVAKNGQNPVDFYDVTMDGAVDYRDLLAIDRQVHPLPPYGHVSSVILCGERYCAPTEATLPVKFWDLSPDGIANQADLDLMQARLDANAVPRLAPVLGEPFPITVRAGEAVDSYVSNLGRDPDGDDRSYQLVILDSGPLTITEDDTWYHSMTISAPMSASGTVQVRYQLRDVHGLLSPEGILEVSVTPPLIRFHNALKAEDVNRDGAVSPLDALLILNLLGTTNGNLSQVVDPALAWDVSNDQYLTPLDALLVINYLNSHLTPPATDELPLSGEEVKIYYDSAMWLTPQDLFVALDRSLDRET